MRVTKLLVVALLSISLVFIFSCKKTAPATTPAAFTLQMKAKYGNQSFALNSANVDSQGRYVVMTLLRFYLSHISLIKTNGDSVKLSDLSIFAFDDTSTLSVSATNVDGDYKGISFGCGLDSVQNNINPNDSVFPNPYSSLWDTYWGMMKYRFQELEGKWDTAAIPVMRNALAYHTGTNSAYRYTQLSKNFSVCCNAPYTLTVYLDVQQIFYNNATGETIDIATEPETSSGPGDNPVILPKFTDNFSHAFTF